MREPPPRPPSSIPILPKPSYLPHHHCNYFSSAVHRTGIAAPTGESAASLPIKRSLPTPCGRKPVVRTPPPGSEEGGNLLPKRLSVKSLRSIALIGCLLSAGCSALPEVSRQPTFHNPLPTAFQSGGGPILQPQQRADSRWPPRGDRLLQRLAGDSRLRGLCPVGRGSRGAMRGIRHFAPRRGRRPAFGADPGCRRADRRRRVTRLQPVLPAADGACKSNGTRRTPGFHPIPAGYGLPWGDVGRGANPCAAGV